MIGWCCVCLAPDTQRWGNVCSEGFWRTTRPPLIVWDRSFYCERVVLLKKSSSWIFKKNLSFVVLQTKQFKKNQIIMQLNILGDFELNFTVKLSLVCTELVFIYCINVYFNVKLLNFRWKFFLSEAQFNCRNILFNVHTKAQVNVQSNCFHFQWNVIRYSVKLSFVCCETWGTLHPFTLKSVFFAVKLVEAAEQIRRFLLTLDLQTLWHPWADFPEYPSSGFWVSEQIVFLWFVNKKWFCWIPLWWSLFMCLVY